MSAGIVYKKISKKKIFDLNSGESSPDCVFQELKAGNFNHALCEDFRFTSWETEGISIKNFIWRRGKFRGVFKNCTFSNGELYNIDFWDSDFENVKFVNVSFFDSEINSSYSLRYLFQLKNVSFENCKFNKFWIGQAVNSEIFFKNCIFIESGFRLKSSVIAFELCSSETKDYVEYVSISLIESKEIEPLKIKDCFLFGIDLVSDLIGVLNISSRKFYIRISHNIIIKNIKIYCDLFYFDTQCRTGKKINEMKSQHKSGFLSKKIIDNMEVFATEGGAFRIMGFFIDKMKISMIGGKTISGSSILYSKINYFEICSGNISVINFLELEIKKLIFKLCKFNEFRLKDSCFLDVSLNAVKIAKKILINETKIDHLYLSNCSIGENAEWESEESMVALLDASESDKKEIKNVSGKKLIQYFERADIEVLK